MIVKIGSYPDYDDVQVDQKREYMEFSDLPGRPKLTFNQDGSITLRVDGGSKAMLRIYPEAANAIRIGVQE